MGKVRSEVTTPVPCEVCDSEYCWDLRRGVETGGLSATCRTCGAVLPLRDAASRGPTLLTPFETAQMYNISNRTLRNWANTGKLTPVLTAGGHRRYRETQVRELMGLPPEDTPPGGDST